MKVLSPQEQLSLAISLTAQKFEGKFDKGGRPYIEHCLFVMHSVDQNDMELMCIAVMHDLVEDTDITLKDLYDMGFSERVVRGVDGMTKRPGEDYEDEFIPRCGMNNDSRLCKIGDLDHNSRLVRLKGIGKKDIDRTKKYQRSYLYLIGV